MALLKLFSKYAATAIVALLFGTAANAAIVVQGEIETIAGTSSIIGGEATEVDYWSFTVNSFGLVTIDVLSWEWDRDNDGTPHFIDSDMFLFKDDGSLDVGDLVASNDDSLNLGSDGSTDTVDSLLSLNLSVGNYLLAIGDFNLSEVAAVAGINYYGYAPAVYDGTEYFYNYDGSCLGLFDCSYGDYQITFSGDVVLPSVPLPAALPMLATGIGLFAFVGRRRKNKTVA